MGGEQELSGPDLARGVPVSSVPDGGVVSGHVGDQPVLVFRRGEAFSALSSACTHYGGPLGEGLVVGETVRCPWHHACFDLRTGEPLRAPALRPLQRFSVEVRAGLVRVTGTEARRPLPTSPGGPESVLIVGGGAAAAAAAEELRRLGYDRPITLVTRDPGPVDRPNLSKDYLAGTAPEEWIPLWDDAYAADHGFGIRHGRVTALEPASRRVTLEDGTALSYGACLLATGADPIRLPLPGADGPNVFTLRTLADSRAIIARAEGARRAVVLGASFLGLEVAASLASRGLEVHVAAPEAVPLERVLGRGAGEAVRRVHEAHGTVFHLGASATAIEPDAVVLSDGTRVAADLVVAAVGVRPAVELAKQAGLAVGDGVIVDGLLRTSAPDVWAAGDVARWPDPHTGRPQRVEHWVLAERQGEAVARNLLGGEEPFAAIPFFWSIHHELVFRYVGFPGGDEIHLHGDLEARDAAIAYRHEGRTLAVATVGRDHLCLEAERLLERDDHEGLLALLPAR